MDNICGKDFLTGPFDECLDCPNLGNGCSGPRTTTMIHERYLVWMKALKKKRNRTNQQIADGCLLSKATVDDFFAGRRKDIGRTTGGLMEDYLIYGDIAEDSKWPCARKLDSDKNVIYEDRPETLEALRLRNEQIDAQRRNYEDLKRSLDTELERVRTEYDDDVKFYREQLALLKDQLNRKDRYIDILIEAANKGGDLKAVEKIKGVE